MAEEKAVRFNTIAYWKLKLTEKGVTNFVGEDKKPLKRDKLRDLAVSLGVEPTKEEKSTLFTKKSATATKEQEEVVEGAGGPFDLSRFDSFVDNGPKIIQPPVAGMSKADLEDLAIELAKTSVPVAESEKPVDLPKAVEKKPLPKVTTAKVVTTLPVKTDLLPVYSATLTLPQAETKKQILRIDGIVITGNFAGHSIELI